MYKQYGYPVIELECEFLMRLRDIRKCNVTHDMEECLLVFENYEKLSIIICDADFLLIWTASKYAVVYLILNNFFVYLIAVRLQFYTDSQEYVCSGMGSFRSYLQKE